MIWNVAIVALLTLGLGVAVSWRVGNDLLARVDRELLERGSRGFGLPGRGPGQVPGPPPEFGPGGFVQGPTPGGPGSREGDRGPDGRGGPPPMFMRNRQANPDMVFVAQGPQRPRTFDALRGSISQFRDDVPWDREAIEKVVSRNSQRELTTVNAEGEEQRVLTLPIPGGKPGWVVQYATPLRETRRAIGGVNQTFFAMLPLALFIAGLGGYLLTARALRPVGKIAEAAAKIHAEDLGVRLPQQGADEFGQLAGTINAMLDRLELAFRELSEAMERQRRFTADASHELRTPLTAIKGHTSLALSAKRSADEYLDALQQVDRSATRMGKLIDDLLTLARTDAGHPSGLGQRVDLAEILDLAREAVPPEGPTLTIDLAQDAQTLAGSASALARVFTNLLANAVRHTPKEGSIAIEAHRSGHRVQITVRDDGEGISPEHLPHLGERFFRVDSARTRSQGGVGLGLAICRAIVEAHGGQIRFESTPGEGTAVRLDLPAFESEPQGS